MRRLNLFFLMLVMIIGFGCGEKPAKPETKTFTPPADGKITMTQKDNYIKASIALQEAMTDYSSKLKDFVETYKLNPDLSQMVDSSFMKDNPDVKKAWDELNKKWDGMQQDVYKSAGIVEEEFNWIGGALTDSINTDIQKEVEKALSSLSETDEGKEEKEEK